MALVLKDRVKETTTTAGTGTVTLAGAVTGFQSFAAVGNGNNTYYTIADPATGDWEVGIGTYTSSGTTLSRDTVLASSNAGNLVTFGSGSKDVFVTYPSERAVWLNSAGSETVQNTFGTANITTGNITTANITSGTVTTTPTSNNDLVNKSYVDAIAAQGVSYHSPVKYEVPNTTGNLTATYNNGSSGVGATLTNAGTQTAFTPDGVVAQVGDRILIYNQTNAFENGVYTVTTVGSGSTNWVLTRATDADTYGVKDPNKLGGGDAFFVTSGNTGAGETYVCTNTGTITFGTTAINFVQVATAQVYQAGTGLTLSSNTFSITNTGVSANTYGSASAVPTIAVNAQGQITSASNTTIAISGSQVSGNISGQAGSVANALTAGSFLTSTGTYDGSVARTFSVDATSANTASKVVARDSNGDFSAGIITANLSGNATTATTSTNLAGGTANQLAYQSSANTTTFATAPSASNQLLSWNGSAFAWTLTPTVTSITLDGGTANGVAYLNASKILTTGSALTFDGTNLGLGVTPAAWGSSWKAFDFSARGGLASGFNETDLNNNVYRNNTGAYLYKQTAAATTYNQSSGLHIWYTAPSGTAGNTISFTQAMTLDASGNLGIGATTVNAKIHAQGAVTSGPIEVLAENTSSGVGASSSIKAIANSTAYAALRTYGTGVTVTAWGLTLANYSAVFADGASSNGLIVGTLTSDPIIFGTNNAEVARIDSSGNLGLGVTPSYKLDVVGSIRAIPASTQDAVIVSGRAGGTGSYAVTMTPTTLTASQTLTLPNETGTILTTAGISGGAF